MTVPTSHRVISPAIWCGWVGYFLTWLLHLWIKTFLRAASPFVIEGTVAAVCGGGLGLLTGVYWAKTHGRPWLRICLCIGTMILIPFVVMSAGLSGMIGTGWLIELVGIRRFLRANQDYRIVEFGYPLGMLLWSALIGWGVCWYYKARRGEKLFSLTSSNPDSPMSTSSPFPCVRAARWCVLLSGVGSWLLHYAVTRNLGWIWGSQSSIEGAMVVLGSLMVSAVTAAYLCRVIRNSFARACAWTAMTILVVGGFGLSGYFGYQAAIVLSRFAFGGYDSEVVLYGYYLFPPIWATTITLGILWYDKATHGGVSMLNFDSQGHHESDVCDKS